MYVNREIVIVCLGNGLKFKKVKFILILGRHKQVRRDDIWTVDNDVEIFFLCCFVRSI